MYLNASVCVGRGGGGTASKSLFEVIRGLVPPWLYNSKKQQVKEITKSMEKDERIHPSNGRHYFQKGIAQALSFIAGCGLEEPQRKFSPA